MTGVGFDFLVEVTRGGVVVGSRPATAAACLDDTLFWGAVAGRVPNDGTLPELALLPEWDGDPPSVTGLCIRFDDAPSRRYGRGIFAVEANALVRATARAIAAEQGSGAERADEASARLAWRVAAREATRRATRFAARASRAPWPLEPASLPGVALGGLDVQIALSVLESVRDETLRAGAVERAWFLLGRVLHDAERGAAAVRVHEAVSVEPGAGGASNIHFAFGPEAWIAARRAAQASGGLVPVGWAHSHPPCARCPANPRCEVDTLFFSNEDREVHATAFASPYMLGLVVGKRRRSPASAPGFRLFGWQHGEIGQRGFRVSGVIESPGDFAYPALGEGR